MGFSLTAAANNTLQRLSDFCRKSTGMSNVFVADNGETYIYERHDKEWEDDRVTGDVYRSEGQGSAYFVGCFHISARGEVVAFPRWPKAVEVVKLPGNNWGAPLGGK